MTSAVPSANSRGSGAIGAGESSDAAPVVADGPIAAPGRDTFSSGSRSYRAVKRVLDLAAALSGLIFSAPLFVVIAIAIKIDSRGPVFFRQTRIGLHGQPFRMWKFRKMRDDLPAQGPMLTKRYDYRMTRVGRVLERLKLDELPQLLDVVHGTMSVVGPRPEVPRFVEFYPELWNEVLSVKPGIFGASQNHFRNESELYPDGDVDLEEFYVSEILPQMLELDVEYARRASVRRDLWLLLGGVTRSLFGAVTWQTILVRRAQILSFLILTALGIGGMSGAHVLLNRPLTTGSATLAVAIAAAAKPAALLLFRIPKALASSMTPDDHRRLVWASLSSSAAISLGMTMLVDTVDYVVLMIDALFFLVMLFVYKLFAYTLYLTFFLHRSWVAARRVFLAGVVFGPLSLAFSAILVYGPGPWLDSRRSQVLIWLFAALLIRPAMLGLVRPLKPHTNYVAWLIDDAASVLAASIVGSSILLVAPLAFGQPSVPLAVVGVDVAIFTSVILLAAARSMVTDRHPAAPDETGPRTRLLIAGSGVELSSYVASLDQMRDGNYEVVGVVTPNRHHRTSSIGGLPVVGSVSDLAGILEVLEVDIVVVLDSSLKARERHAVEQQAERRSVRRFHVNLIPHLDSTRAAVDVIEPETSLVVDLTAERVELSGGQSS